MKITQEMLFGLVAIIGFAIVRTRMKTASLAHLGWDELVARLEPVPMEEISEIALDYLQPSKGKDGIESAKLWSMIGETEGLQRLYKNAEILVALASYAERWNPEKAFVAVGQMRRDAMTLRRASLRLSVGLTLGHDMARGPFCVQEAASAYFLMRSRVLALYETTHAGRMPRLTAAL